MAFQKNAPPVVVWSTPQDLSNGPVLPQDYANPDIICHVNATAAPISASVTAGTNVTVFWTKDYPKSHTGPMLSFLAACPGNDCTKADKTKLKFFKVDAQGLIDGTKPPGVWATDVMVANNASWSFEIPPNIKAGQYVLRHETIALHQAQGENGAQNYPFCMNLDIKGSGTAQPEGVLGTELYNKTDPGLVVNIFKPLTEYTIPGPAQAAF